MDSATPPICDASVDQPSTHAQNAQMPAKGTTNESPPISRLSRSFSRIAGRSTSAPARKVITMPPNDAMKSIHGGLARSRMLPARTPRLISISATDTASSTDVRLAIMMSRPMSIAVQSGSSGASSAATEKNPHRFR